MEAVGEEVTGCDKENQGLKGSSSSTSPEKTFDGGFFTIKSPRVFIEEISDRREKHPDTRVTRSAGNFRTHSDF